MELIRNVSALFVDPKGPYPSLVADCWDEKRDARLYTGPNAVVAHPPCQRWGRYWHGGPSVKQRLVKGDDGGCFASALASVRRYGGVLEHPEASSAWDVFGLNRPAKQGVWVNADLLGGWTCCVEQGHYGHRARKATWLYVFGARTLPSLTWGKSGRSVRLDDGFLSAEERRRSVHPPKGITSAERAARHAWLDWYAKETGKEWCCPERLSKRERSATPLPFAKLLISIAQGCAGAGGASNA